MPFHPLLAGSTLRYKILSSDLSGEWIPRTYDSFRLPRGIPLIESCPNLFEELCHRLEKTIPLETIHTDDRAIYLETKGQIDDSNPIIGIIQKVDEDSLLLSVYQDQKEEPLMYVRDAPTAHMFANLLWGLLDRCLDMEGVVYHFRVTTITLTQEAKNV